MRACVSRVRRLRVVSTLGALAMIAMLLAPLGASASSGRQNALDSAGNVPAPWQAPRTVYIPETGQSLDGVFLDFWRANNGIANYGYPISPEIQENGRTVQYFSYARFEYWPEDPNGIVVQLGKIGQELRPKTVLRATFAGIGVSAGASSVNRDMAAFSQAWLPIDDQDVTQKPATATWRFVPETGHTVQNGFKNFWEATGEASYLGNPLTEEYKLNGRIYQIFERGQLAWEKDKDPWMVPLGPVLTEKYAVSTAPTAQGDLPIYSEDLFIRPAGSGGEHWIEVSINNQYLWAWEGDTLVLETYVSTGRFGIFDTPLGTFYINTKLESQTMSGVLGGESYNVPDVPWVMYFTDVGHAIHGTYWHSNFGTPMSHGCINLPMDVAEWMYGWASIGTRVVIHE